MLDALDITEEEAQGLAEIARHDLELARDFARRALAAEDNDEANRLARSYQRAARSYRQTLAVKARLKRDLAAAAQVQSGIPRPKPGGAAIARRIGELRGALLRLGWDEAERPEESDFLYDSPEEGFADRRQDIEIAITNECLKPAFGEEPLDDHVARARPGLQARRHRPLARLGRPAHGGHGLRRRRPRLGKLGVAAVPGRRRSRKTREPSNNACGAGLSPASPSASRRASGGRRCGRR